MHIVVFEEADITPVISTITALPDMTVNEGVILQDALRHVSMRLVVTIGRSSVGPAFDSRPPACHTAEIVVETVVTNAWNAAEHRFRYDKKGAAGERARTATLADLTRLQAIVDHLEDLLKAPGVHEKHDVHPLIAENPFLIHPNPSQVWSEVAIGIGTEYRIDFVIREADGSYLLVELENPSHQLFTSAGDFAAVVNHAVRQVEDWQEWIEENISTAQKLLPGIIAPRGLVIVGSSSDLTPRERNRLGRRNVNFRGRMAIWTYDDAIASARAFIEAMRKALEP